jgi:endoribonuclease Dicer
MSLSKGLASEKARQVLEDPTSEFHLPRLCDCGKAAVIDDTPTVPNPEPLEEDLEVLDDTTEEGFAALARMQLEQSCPPETDEPMDIDVSDDDDIEGYDDWTEEREVEAMLVDEM